MVEYQILEVSDTRYSNTLLCHTLWKEFLHIYLQSFIVIIIYSELLFVFIFWFSSGLDFCIVGGAREGGGDAPLKKSSLCYFPCFVVFPFALLRQSAIIIFWRELTSLFRQVSSTVYFATTYQHFLRELNFEMIVGFFRCHSAQFTFSFFYIDLFS